MEFRTKVPIVKSDFPIDYKSKLFFLGSCFSENIGAKFQYYKFQATVNPFGIIFNPVSLEKIIQRCVQKDFFTENDVFFHNDLWHCFEVHSELSTIDKDNFLNRLNQIITDTHQEISAISHFQVTLGTSWVYRYKETEQIVANCHKVPQKQFTKQLLSVAEIEDSLYRIISLVHSINPKVKFVLTVSPVRHIKDGFVENNVSKAHLMSAVYKVVANRSLKVDYFPSYEIIMDELRDYRFYKNDMLHPNDLAVAYIWDKITEAFFQKDTLSILDEVQLIQKNLAHKPFNPNTEIHQKFMKTTQDKIDLLVSKFQFMNFSS